MKSLELALLLLTLALPAYAVDGVIEINQACVTTGCHPADVPGFPVTIGGSGSSYRLTSDLDTSPDVDLSPIVVTADNVMLDLNGFSLRGPVVCTGSGSTVSCTPGLGAGIAASNDSGLTIRDGTIQGFAAQGIIAGERAQIRNVHVNSNGGHGIEVGLGSLVSSSIAHRNFRSGIVVSGLGGTVERCVGSSNRQNGLQVSTGGSVIESVATQNGLSGIESPFGGITIRNNSAILNEGNGIDCDNVACLISDNNASGNGFDGIEANGGSTIQRNVAYNNANLGLNLGFTDGYRENSIGANTVGAVSGGVNMGANSCSAVICP